MKRLALIAIAVLAASLAAQTELYLSVDMERPVISAGPRQRAFIKIGLSGFEWSRGEDRAPLNVALVLDRSGSMVGDKLERAMDAAEMAVGFLGPRDVLSIIVYDDEANVIFPAARMTDRRRAVHAIRSIRAGGNTALFAGVSKGAREIRKYLDRERVNRVILLSDGLANVGPDRPGELADLGASLLRDGISVTTIGLGLDYNEDLMTRLAQASDGNHAFVREPADLARIFDLEFRDAFEVVAQDVDLIVTCARGVRPVGVLNREAEISGAEVRVGINNVYSLQDRYFLLEVELPETDDGERLDVADVSVSYRNMATAKASRLSSRLSALATSDRKASDRTRNKDVAEKVAIQESVIASEEAVKLRDSGRVDEAKGLLKKTARKLKSLSVELDSDTLKEASDSNEASAAVIDDEATWGANRKEMLDDQYSARNQQRY
jgi:Ca-activated chloride channel homolog